MIPSVSIGSWVSLPSEVRSRIRTLFEIPKSSTVDVIDGVIATDGVTHEDFKVLTVEKMQKYLGDESTDFYKLFDKVVATVMEELMGVKKDTVQVSSDSSVTIVIEPKKRGRPKKK